MGKKDKNFTKEEQKQTRIAIISSDRCKPKKCMLECKKSCPVVRMGQLCIQVSQTDKIALISETLCIGCGICVKVKKKKKLIKNRNVLSKLFQLSIFQKI